MENQKIRPQVNVGTIGHVDHGRSTLAAAIVHVQNTRRNNLKKNIVIVLDGTKPPIEAFSHDAIIVYVDRSTHNEEVLKVVREHLRSGKSLAAFEPEMGVLKLVDPLQDPAILLELKKCLNQAPIPKGNWPFDSTFGPKKIPLKIRPKNSHVNSIRVRHQY